MRKIVVVKNISTINVETYEKVIKPLYTSMLFVEIRNQNVDNEKIPMHRHSTINKIMTGGWDYVVIQGQSQEPIVASSQFNSGASALHSLIKHYNPCAVTMPYMTWGRKNGDAANCPFFPVMCTYQGMDTTLRNS